MRTGLVAGFLVPSISPGDETTQGGVREFNYPDADYCPMGFYYDGLSRIFGCKKCPFGSTTDGTGSTGLDECSTDICTPCGAGIQSEPRQQDEIIDPDAVIANNPWPGLVPATKESCYIEAGWGIVPDMANLGKLKAVIPCPANTYECPIGRYTRYVVNDGQYQDQIEDCLVPAGSGTFQANASDPWAPPNRTALMNALPCPIGWYGVGDSPDATATVNPLCVPCPAGQSTAVEGSSACDGEADQALMP
eukprot:gene4823-5070_t